MDYHYESLSLWNFSESWLISARNLVKEKVVSTFYSLCNGILRNCIFPTAIQERVYFQNHSVRKISHHDHLVWNRRCTMHRHWSGWRKKMSVRSQYPWFVCWAFSVCIRIINAAFLYDIWHFAFPFTPNKSQNQIKRILVTILLLFKWQTIVVQHTFIWTRQTGKVTAF